MRAIASLTAVVCGLLAASPAIVFAEGKTRERQDQDCAKAYEHCEQQATDWYHANDRTRIETKDQYYQMIDACRVHRMWCREEIAKSTSSD